VSHDVPFEDSQSGTIKVSIEAKTEIFVNDGLSKEALKKHFNDSGEQIKPFEFNSFNGQYFIPATSLKGMVRNVLEVMSFGRMQNKVNDHRFALRDLSGAMKEIYLNNFKPEDAPQKGINGVRCGWLYKNESGTYSLDDCGIPGRVSHKVIDDTFNTNLCDFYGEREADSVEVMITISQLKRNTNFLETMKGYKDFLLLQNKILQGGKNLI